MPAVVVFGLSAIACRDFFLYYWRAVSGVFGLGDFARMAIAIVCESRLVLKVQEVGTSRPLPRTETYTKL